MILNLILDQVVLLVLPVTNPLTPTVPTLNVPPTIAKQQPTNSKLAAISRGMHRTVTGTVPPTPKLVYPTKHPTNAVPAKGSSTPGTPHYSATPRDVTTYLINRRNAAVSRDKSRSLIVGNATITVAPVPNTTPQTHHQSTLLKSLRTI